MAEAVDLEGFQSYKERSNGRRLTSTISSARHKRPKSFPKRTAGRRSRIGMVQARSFETLCIEMQIISRLSATEIGIERSSEKLKICTKVSPSKNKKMNL